LNYLFEEKSKENIYNLLESWHTLDFNDKLKNDYRLNINKNNNIFNYLLMKNKKNLKFNLDDLENLENSFF
jgi:hypothetical protein